MRQLFLTTGNKILLELEYAAAVINIDPARRDMSIRLYLDGFVVDGNYPIDCNSVGGRNSGAPFSQNYITLASTGVVSSTPFIPGICEQHKEFRLHVLKEGRRFYKEVPGQEISGMRTHTPCKAEEIPPFIARKTELAVKLARLCDEGIRELRGMAQEKVEEDNAQEEFFHSLINTLAAIC